MPNTRSLCAPIAVLVVLLMLGIPGRPGGDPTEAIAGAHARTDRRSVGSPEGAGHSTASRSERSAGSERATTPRSPDPREIFRGLGAWVDLFDYPVLDPARALQRMKRNGVRTVYVQTGRSNTRAAVSGRVGRWLVEAHDRGIAVVGWYLPDYANVGRDLHRTMAIRRYRYRGHSFDGLGIDVEYRGVVRSLPRWNRNVADHARRVRVAAGRFPVATIPPTPLQMAVAPGYWHGFPWTRIARNADAVLLMSYWSDRSGCPRIRRHCAYEFTARNVRITRRLMGTRHPVVHVIGGVGDSISDVELRRFVQGARDAGADGASIYDVVTTRGRWWRLLRPLRSLGTDRAGKARGRR